MLALKCVIIVASLEKEVEVLSSPGAAAKQSLAVCKFAKGPPQFVVQEGPWAFFGCQGAILFWSAATLTSSKVSKIVRSGFLTRLQRIWLHWKRALYTVATYQYGAMISLIPLL